MRLLFVTRFLKAVLVLSCLFLSCSATRMKYSFNSDWKLLVGDPSDASSLSFNDSNWKPVTLPHAWNEDDAFRVAIWDLPTGIAWYRKRFKVPDTAKDKKLFLEFEGIRFGGEFYLNGHWIGRGWNGVMAFGFDITNVTLFGQENVLAARIDNSWDYADPESNTTFQWNDKNFYANYGGINKHVYLHVTDKLYQTLPLYTNLTTTGVYVYAKDINVEGKSATIVAESQVKNEYGTAVTASYSVTIRDRLGRIVGTFNGGKYSLSAFETTTINASATVSELEFWSWGYGYLYDVTTELKINGRSVDLVTTRTGFRKTEFTHGMVKLNDRTIQVKGYGQRTTNEWPALGCAVPAWLSEFSNSLVLQAHGALIRWMHVTPWKQDVESLDRLGIMQAMPAGDSEGDATGIQWEQRKALMRDAIIYNKNNPSIVFIESGNHGISEDHMAEMKAIRDQYDPFGGRAIGAREMLNSSIAEYGGEMLYIDKSARKPFWQMEYERDEGARKYWDNYTYPYHLDGDANITYDRNQDSHAIENVARWFDYYEQRPGTGKRVNSGGVKIIFSDSNTHYRNAYQNYRLSGAVDALRIPKDGWYAHQVMWNTWVDIEVPATHIIGHWNYNASTTKNVSVVSTAERVELRLNGKSIGWGEKTKRFLFTFGNVSWASGELNAIGYDGTKETSSDVRSTTGEPYTIRLTATTSPSGFQADGADIALVTVEVLDARGQRVPTANHLIDFTLSGEAEWRGGVAIRGPLVAGVPQDNYILSKTLPVEGGINRVLLRSTTEAGVITLKAQSGGLKSAAISLRTKPFRSTDGLSTWLPGIDLAPNLSRGPTPKGTSYTTKRLTLQVASAEAGSTETGTPESTYDDDEDTYWGSTSSTSSAWITYTMAYAAKINQVVVKFNKFSNTAYHVKVLVDEEIVWSGDAGTSLGYTTFSFDATTGTNVTIASTSGKLQIIEAELYGPVNSETARHRRML